MVQPLFGHHDTHSSIIFSKLLYVAVPGGGGGDLEEFYPDMCVEGLEKHPF